MEGPFLTWQFGEVFVYILPLMGALFYIGTRPKYLVNVPAIAWAPVAGTMSPVDEVAYAHSLLEQGKITEAEFDEIKRKTL